MIKIDELDDILNKLYAAFETAKQELEESLEELDRKDEEIQQLRERISELEAK